MNRLADYFVVVGYDYSSSKHGESRGIVLQKFPDIDWPECPYRQSVEQFCQPSGWYLSSVKSAPTFIICVLTDEEGRRLYAACLTFMEAVRPLVPAQSSPSVLDTVEETEDSSDGALKEIDEDNLDEEEESDSRCNSLIVDPNLVRPADLYAPKSLVLISRHDSFDLLRNCLGIVYTVYIDNLNYQLESVVANILCGVNLPGPGGPRVSFSLGVGDRQTWQPPQSTTLPITSNSVAMLFKQLGIQNVLLCFSALLNDQKVMVCSRSYYRVADACRALVALLYPLKYSYVYIPVLPKSVLEVLCTPTPILVGIHISSKEYMPDVFDLIVADLDGGSVEVPQHLGLSLLTEPFYTRTLEHLTKILNPELLLADNAFSEMNNDEESGSDIRMDPYWQDKQLRAVFISLFTELFAGYRHLLAITRIHPEPVISFHASLFLKERGLPEADDFLRRLYSSMAFSTFVQERAPPFRVCDVFDDVYGNVDGSPQDNIQLLAKRLWANEKDVYPSGMQKLPRPVHGAHTRLHQPPFPNLDLKLFHDALSKAEQRSARNSHVEVDEVPPEARIVPHGHLIKLERGGDRTHDAHSKREVLRNCVTHIFDNKISDAKKILRAVKRDLKSRTSRHHLMEELNAQLSRPLSIVEEGFGSRAQLNLAQFELVVELMDEALKHDATSGVESCTDSAGDFLEPVNRYGTEDSGIATAVIQLAIQFNHQVNAFKYYAYMCEDLQKHDVWKSSSFWESYFHREVHKEIRQLYLPRYAEQYSSTHLSALDITAEEMRNWHLLSREEQSVRIQQEERTVYSQIIHALTLMVFFRFPVNISEKKHHRAYGADGHDSSSDASSSINDTDSIDRESGFGDNDLKPFIASVDMWMRRFVDKMSNENSLPSSQINDIKGKIEDLLEGHISNLDDIWQEVKRLPKTKKLEIIQPALLPGEDFVLNDPLRVYLLPDGRNDAASTQALWDDAGSMVDAGNKMLWPDSSSVGGGGGGGGGGVAAGGSGGRQIDSKSFTLTDEGLLPSEGNLYLTNYRVIFKGIPSDVLQTEKVITRSFPVSSLLNAKKLGTQRLMLPYAKEDSYECVQLRSATFQLIKIAYHEEVRREEREEFRTRLLLCRYPLTVEQSFPSSTLAGGDDEKRKDAAKSSSTLKRARHVIQQKVERARHKVGKRYPSPSAHRRSPLFTEDSRSDQLSLQSSLDGSELEVTRTVFTQESLVERLRKLPAYTDLLRRQTLAPLSLSFATRQHNLRVSLANTKYHLCPSYPALLVVPKPITDVALSKLVKSHRQGRLPVIVYRHAQSRALLLRSSGFHSKGLVGMLKHATGGGATTSSTFTDDLKTLRRTLMRSPALEANTSSNTSESNLAKEQEKFFTALVSLSPTPRSLVCDDYDEAVDAFARDSTGSGLRLSGFGARSGHTPVLPRRTASGMSVSSGAVGHRTPLERLRFGMHAKSKSPAFERGSYLTSSLTFGQFASNARRSLRQVTVGVRWGKTDTISGVPVAESPTSSGHSNKRFLSTSGNQNGHDEAYSETSTECYVPPPRAKRVYVFGDRHQMHSIKHSTDSFAEVEFLPVEYPSKSTMKESLKKFHRLVLPADLGAGTAHLVALKSSDWLWHVRVLLQVAGAVVDLMDLQASTVVVALEDGWDATAQIVSLAQVMLEPYYRTLDGFMHLVEKEWLSFGHRFTQRGSQTEANRQSGFAPVFLLFLDAVHQLLRQFPTAFEFNDFYLRFLAYHHVSNRFNTFKLDCEADRLPWLLGTPGNVSPEKFFDKSVWRFVDDYGACSPVFYNFMYVAPPKTESSPTSGSQVLSSSCSALLVLRPAVQVTALDVWSFYLSEEMAAGPAFDLELHMYERRRTDEVDAAQENILQTNYNVGPVSCASQIQRLVSEPGLYDNLGWRGVWEEAQREGAKIGEMLSEEMLLGEAWREETMRKVSLQQMRFTRDLLWRGNIQPHSDPFDETRLFGKAHRFHPVNYIPSRKCDFCNHYLMSINSKAVVCADCSYFAHEKCCHNVQKNCTRRSVSSELTSAAMESSSSTQNFPAAPSTTPLPSSVTPQPNQAPPSVSSSPASTLEGHAATTTTTTASTPPAPAQSSSSGQGGSPVGTTTVTVAQQPCRGYLYKQGQVFGRWKRRYFVLDPIRHQLQFFDSEHDACCRNIIQLIDVKSVQFLKSVNGGPKKVPDNGFFELDAHRLYRFGGEDVGMVRELVERLQTSIS